MRKRLVGLLGLGLVTGALTGCCHCRPDPVVRPGSSVPVAAPPPVAPPAVAGPGGTVPALPPPPAVPAIPPTGATLNYSPSAEIPEVRLFAPEPPTSAEPPLAQLVPPENNVPRAAVKESPSVEVTAPTPPLPVGIPQFAYAQEGKVAVGLKPLLDGIDWLQSNGFRTVLHIKAPGEEDVADRRLVEKHGMKYVTLEVSPETLNRQTIEAFGRFLGDREAQPLFIYDRDGMHTGGLWYLHFRTSENLGDEASRTRAERLGLKTSPEGEQKSMWLAIQKLLSQQP
jgi:hypothetical protein